MFWNAGSSAKTNVIATVYFTDDDVSFYDSPEMLIRKTAKLCIDSTWIALLIDGFVLVQTWRAAQLFIWVVGSGYIWCWIASSK